MPATAKTESFAAVITVAYLPEKQAFEALAWDWLPNNGTLQEVADYLASDRDNPVLTHQFAVDDTGSVVANPFTFSVVSNPFTLPVVVPAAPAFAAVFRCRLGHEVECFRDSDSAMERFDDAEYPGHAIPKPSEDGDGLGVYDLAADGTATRWTDNDFDDAYAAYRGEVRQARRDLTALPRYYHAGVL